MGQTQSANKSSQNNKENLENQKRYSELLKNPSMLAKEMIILFKKQLPISNDIVTVENNKTNVTKLNLIINWLEYFIKFEKKSPMDYPQKIMALFALTDCVDLVIDKDSTNHLSELHNFLSNQLGLNDENEKYMFYDTFFEKEKKLCHFLMYPIFDPYHLKEILNSRDIKIFDKLNKKFKESFKENEPSRLQFYCENYQGKKTDHLYFCSILWWDGFCRLEQDSLSAKIRFLKHISKNSKIFEKDYKETKQELEELEVKLSKEKLKDIQNNSNNINNSIHNNELNTNYQENPPIVNLDWRNHNPQISLGNSRNSTFAEPFSIEQKKIIPKSFTERLNELKNKINQCIQKEGKNENLKNLKESIKKFRTESSFVCLIAVDIPNNPVKLKGGNDLKRYEKLAIIEWLETNPVDPTDPNKKINIPENRDFESIIKEDKFFYNLIDEQIENFEQVFNKIDLSTKNNNDNIPKFK